MKVVCMRNYSYSHNRYLLMNNQNPLNKREYWHLKKKAKQKGRPPEGRIQESMRERE